MFCVFCVWFCVDCIHLDSLTLITPVPCFHCSSCHSFRSCVYILCLVLCQLLVHCLSFRFCVNGVVVLCIYYIHLDYRVVSCLDYCSSCRLRVDVPVCSWFSPLIIFHQRHYQSSSTLHHRYPLIIIVAIWTLHHSSFLCCVFTCL